MTMQLRIQHTTGFEYDGKANTSFNAWVSRRLG